MKNFSLISSMVEKLCTISLKLLFVTLEVCHISRKINFLHKTWNPKAKTSCYPGFVSDYMSVCSLSRGLGIVRKFYLNCCILTINFIYFLFRESSIHSSKRSDYKLPFGPLKLYRLHSFEFWCWWFKKNIFNNIMYNSP